MYSSFGLLQQLEANILDFFTTLFYFTGEVVSEISDEAITSSDDRMDVDIFDDTLIVSVANSKVLYYKLNI